MQRRGLLSRIAGAGPADEIEAIVAHVRALLNTRAGAAVCAPSLGVPDLSGLVHAFPDCAPRLGAAIRATILEREPRLDAVAVRHVPAEGDPILRFEIVARRAGRAAGTLRMSTTVRPGGPIDVTA